MRKIVLTCLLVCLCASSAFALAGGILPYGVGAKFAGMGGAGSALVDDVTSAYYNPAGIVRSQAASLKLAAGTASDGSSQLMSVLGNLGNPSKFIIDNMANKIDVNGSVNAFLGLTVAKVGISILPIASLNLNKAAGVATGTVVANGNFEGALTLGYGLGIPMVGAVNIGANLKYISNTTAMGAVAVGAQTNTIMTYTGTGFDVGAQANIDAIPMVPLKAALVLKDIGATLTGKQDVTTTPTGGSPSTTSTNLPGVTNPTTLTLGVAGDIPVVGLKVAIDLDNVSGGTGNQSYSVTHIGIEYPVLGVLALRAGTISGGPSAAPISMTTLGAGIMGVVNIATVTDNNNTKNNQIMVDLGIGF